jgi:nucleoside diphosphate kinase
MDKHNLIHIIKGTSIQSLAFPQGIFESEFESSLSQFIENNKDSRVFSYLSPSYIDIQKIHASNAQLTVQIENFQSNAPNQQLPYKVTTDIISYSNPQLVRFSNYNMIYDDADDIRDLTLIATKPTMFDVDVQNQFMKLFHQEGCTFVGCKIINFNDDDTYKKLYKISQKAAYSKFWRDYLNSSQINFICAVKVTNIPAFAKLFDMVRHNTGINWPKNPAHKSSSENEAEQNLNDFFPELLIQAEENKVNQK